MTGEDLVGGPLVQLALYEPDCSDGALLEAMAEALRARGATTKPIRWGGGGLEVVAGTGAIPAGVAERLEPARSADSASDPAGGAIVELMTGGEHFDPELDLEPEELQRFGRKVRDCMFDLVTDVRPLYAAMLFEYPPDDLAQLQTTDDDVLFGSAGWVNLARVEADVESRLRQAVLGTATADVGGGLYWTTWSEFAPDGTSVDRELMDEHVSLRVIEALTGRTIPPPVVPTQEEIDAMWWLKPPVDRPMVWVWDSTLDETALLAGVAACSGGRDVDFRQGAEGWRCAAVDLLGAEDDEAMDVLRCLAEQMAPSWISLSGVDEIWVPGSSEPQLEGFTLYHVWLNRAWLGEAALARIDEHLAGAYRAEHAGGTYFSTGLRFNPSGRAPAWSSDERFDRTLAAAIIVAAVARRSRGLATLPPPV